jgi:RNA polymerase-binding transcription factor DksA
MYESEIDKQKQVRNDEIFNFYKKESKLAKRQSELLKFMKEKYGICEQQIRNILKEKGMKFRGKNPRNV